MPKALTLRQRLAMGLTLPKIAKVVLAMREADQLEGRSSREIALEVLGELQAANPAAFEDPEIDWDAVIAWIEKMVEFIMAIIEVIASFFDQVTPS